jgi:hypothetical protein
MVKMQFRQFQIMVGVEGAKSITCHIHSEMHHICHRGVIFDPSVKWKKRELLAIT